MAIIKLSQNHVPQCQGTDLCLQVIPIRRRQGNNAFWLTAPCKVPVHLISYHVSIPKGIHNEQVINICPKSSNKQIVHGKAGVTHIHKYMRLVGTLLSSVREAVYELQDDYCGVP